MLDTQRLTAYGLTPAAIVTQLQNTNLRGQAGSFARDNREFQVEASTFFTSLEDLNQVVVGLHAGHPVYLRDVAERIQDGTAEPDTYVLFANARGGAQQNPGVEYPAVTITVAKRKGTNATDIPGGCWTTSMRCAVTCFPMTSTLRPRVIMERLPRISPTRLGWSPRVCNQ